jgi:hypothetical protein
LAKLIRALTRIFLSHLYKSFTRSSSAGRDTALQIALGFIAVALIAYALILGFALERIITNTLKQADPITFLNGFLIYYLIGEFITRYFFQSLPALDVRPYLHLPVPRSRIANFLVGRSLVFIMNIFVFLLFVPFAVGPIADAYGSGQAWVWLLSLWFFSLINHFTLVLVKRRIGQSALSLFTFIFICALLACADHFGWLKLSLMSQELFRIALHGYALVLILFLTIVLLYFVVHRTFINKLYLEDLSAQEDQAFRSGSWEFYKGSD